VNMRRLHSFHCQDDRSLKDMVLASVNLVLDDEAVSKLEQAWYVFEPIEDVIGVRLEDIPAESLCSETHFSRAMKDARDRNKARKARARQALQKGGWIYATSENTRSKQGREPNPKSVELMLKFALGAPYDFVKREEKAKARDRYSAKIKYQIDRQAQNRARRNADTCALTSIKRAHDRFCRDIRIPEKLYRCLLFSPPPPTPDMQLLRSQAKESEEKIRRMMRDRGMHPGSHSSYGQ
jgi:hypothetical protein